MKKFKNVENLRNIAWVLLVIGGINRGLIGLFNFNVVELIFGYGFFSRVVYTIVGIATVYILINPKKKSLHTPMRK